MAAFQVPRSSIFSIFKVAGNQLALNKKANACHTVDDAFVLWGAEL